MASRGLCDCEVLIDFFYFCFSKNLSRVHLLFNDLAKNFTCHGEIMATLAKSTPGTAKLRDPTWALDTVCSSMLIRAILLLPENSEEVFI